MNNILPWLKNFILALLGILAPIKTVLITAGVLIFIDLITGLWAAKKQGREISSAGLRRTVSKMLVYQLVIITGFLVEKYLLEGFLPVSKLCASVIGIVELTSILENSNKILGLDIFKALIQKLGSINDKPQG